MDKKKPKKEPKDKKTSEVSDKKFPGEFLENNVFDAALEDLEKRRQFLESQLAAEEKNGIEKDLNVSDDKTKCTKDVFEKNKDFKISDKRKQEDDVILSSINEEFLGETKKSKRPRKTSEKTRKSSYQKENKSDNAAESCDRKSDKRLPDKLSSRDDKEGRNEVDGNEHKNSDLKSFKKHSESKKRRSGSPDERASKKEKNLVNHQQGYIVQLVRKNHLENIGNKSWQSLKVARVRILKKAGISMIVLRKLSLETLQKPSRLLKEDQMRVQGDTASHLTVVHKHHQKRKIDLWKRGAEVP